MFENIPNNWKKLEAEKYCFAVTDGTHDSPKPVEYNGIYLLTSKNITSGHLDYKNAYSISKEDFEKINKRSLVEKYDILFSMIGTVGESCIVDTDYINFAIKNVGLFKLNGDKIKAKWLNYFFKTANANLYIKQNLKGGNQKYIALNILRQFPIPVPPTLGEQQEIVDVLDAASEIIRLRTACIESAQSLIPALFQEMFGDPINNNKNYPCESLKKLCSKIGSGATPRGGKESYLKEGISFVRSMNVHDGIFQYKDLAFINDEQAKLLDNVELQESDVLINITGASVARTCIVPKEILPARVNQHVSILRCTGRLNPYFLNVLLYFQTTKQKLLDLANSKGATREAITKQQLELFKIILPPIEQQELFAEKVQEIEAYIKAQQAELENAKTLFQSLLHHSFTGELTRRAYGE